MTLQPPTKIWKQYQNCHSLRSDAQQGGNVHEAFQNLRNLQTTTIKRFDSLDTIIHYQVPLSFMEWKKTAKRGKLSLFFYKNK